MTPVMGDKIPKLCINSTIKFCKELSRQARATIPGSVVSQHRNRKGGAPACLVSFSTSGHGGLSFKPFFRLPRGIMDNVERCTCTFSHNTPLKAYCISSTNLIAMTPVPTSENTRNPVPTVGGDPMQQQAQATQQPQSVAELPTAALELAGRVSSGKKRGCSDPRLVWLTLVE